MKQLWSAGPMPSKVSRYRSEWLSKVSRFGRCWPGPYRSPTRTAPRAGHEAGGRAPRDWPGSQVGPVRVPHQHGLSGLAGLSSPSSSGCSVAAYSSPP